MEPIVAMIQEAGYQLQELESRPAAPARLGTLWLNLRDRDSVYGLACCAIVLILLLIAKPFADAGFIDDWSYAHLALRFAETGRVHYNGWNWAAVLFQTVWGALWIRLFGFSFNVLRIATLPFSLGFVWLVYALARKIGLRRDLACFGALVVGTSPLYIPLAASFMTDAYGCFFTALCLYATLCSAEATGRRSAAFWLWILAISGILGGSDRQTVWAAPLSLIPYLFWSRRSERRFCLQAIVAYAVCLVSLAFVVHLTPTYTPLQSLKDQTFPALLQNSVAASARLTGFLLTSLELALPCLLCFAPFWKRLGPLLTAEILAASGVIIFVLVSLIFDAGAVPFMGPVVSEYGILRRGTDALGYRPILLPPVLRFGLSMLVAFSGLAFWSLRNAASARLARTSMGAFVCFTCAYLPLLIPGAISGNAHDRYVLPLMPVLVLFILHRFQSLDIQVPLAAWACLVLVAVWSVLITHDYAAALRARVQAAQVLERRGIAKSRISAGYEYDGWAELQLAGRVVAPHGSQRNLTNQFWFWNYTRALQPEYVASYFRPADRPSDSLLQVTFYAWTPPFRRAVIVKRRQDLRDSKTCDWGKTCSFEE